LAFVIFSRWEGNQYELAQRCHIDNSTLTKYVRGIRVPATHHRAMLAHVLRVEPSDLDGWMTGEDLWQKVAS